MRLATRKLLDKAFSGVGLMSIVVMAAALLVILVPIFKRGIGAFVFKATVEHRLLLVEKFQRGSKTAVATEAAQVDSVRKPMYDMINRYTAEQQTTLDEAVRTIKELAARDDSLGRFAKRRLKRMEECATFTDRLQNLCRVRDSLKRREIPDEVKAQVEKISGIAMRIETRTEPFQEFNEVLHKLFGPSPGEPPPVMPSSQYGQTRWDRAQLVLHDLLYIEKWDYSGTNGMGTKVYEPRVSQFEGSALAPLFPYVEENIEEMLKPRLTFYWGFFADSSLDAHIFGGIFPELLGTVYLTIGAILFAVPLGIIAAIYFTEYARAGKVVGFLRICVSTLAGVPSIVFGMFGLAFFLNTCHMPKCVLAGSLTLGLLILPTIIRASEEAIRAVPHTYKEAALSLGAGRWHTVTSVILPASLPGILTGIVISMGRAAGETAPIIFTAAASVAAVLSMNPLEAWSQPTAALSWNIYNLCTEHEAVDEIRHVQFGMVTVLVSVVLLLNLTAIIIRARISKKLKG